MAPYEKLKSLPGAEQYLRPDITFKALDATAAKQSDLDAWAQLKKAHTKLFDTIFGQATQVA